MGCVLRPSQVIQRVGLTSALFVIRIDGGGLRQLTPDGLGALQPDWSPNGRLIVFNNEVHQPGRALLLLNQALAAARQADPTHRSATSR